MDMTATRDAGCRRLSGVTAQQTIRPQKGSPWTGSSLTCLSRAAARPAQEALAQLSTR